MYNKKGIFGLAIGLIILIGISRSIIQNNLEKTQSDITIEDAGGENSRTEEEISLGIVNGSMIIGQTFLKRREFHVLMMQLFW